MNSIECRASVYCSGVFALAETQSSIQAPGRIYVFFQLFDHLKHSHRSRFRGLIDLPALSGVHLIADELAVQWDHLVIYASALERC